MAAMLAGPRHERWQAWRLPMAVVGTETQKTLRMTGREGGVSGFHGIYQRLAIGHVDLIR